MKQVRRALLIWLVCSIELKAQTNRVQNFSFETAGNNPNLAANWNAEGAGYQRVPLTTGNWDGSYALSLSGNEGFIIGANQRITLNQGSAKPILITARVKGVNLTDSSGDKIGASLDCRVKFASLSQTELSYCPATLKTKNVGTFDWRYVGFNTANLVHGDLAIEWLEVRVRRGAISGTAYFDDIHVAEYDPGTFNGAVTFMFDDCYKEHRALALPKLAARGWVGAEAAVSTYLSSGDSAYCNLDDVLALQNGGWEILSHTAHHLDLTTLSPTQMEDELYWSKKFFNDNGIPARNLALPFGAYNSLILGINAERAYYSSVRNSDKGYNAMGSFPYSIKVQEATWNTTLADIQDWVNAARTRKLWLVILVHKMRPTCPDQYCVTVSRFDDLLSAVQSSTLPVVTYDQGLTLIKSPR